MDRTNWSIVAFFLILIGALFFCPCMDKSKAVVLEKDWETTEFLVELIDEGKCTATEDLCTDIFQDYEEGDTLPARYIKKYLVNNN